MCEDLKFERKQKQLAAMSDIGKSICDFVAEKNIENVVFLDRSARPAYIPFKEQWNQNHKDEKRPSIYFMSPKLLERNTVGKEEIELIKKEHPYLTSKDAPTLVFDVCVKSGLTFYNVTNLLEGAGMSEVYTMATAVHDDQKQYFQADKILYDNHKLGCHLFGSFLNKEIGVGRGENSLLAKVNENHPVSVPFNRRELRLVSRNTTDK